MPQKKRQLYICLDLWKRCWRIWALSRTHISPWLHHSLRQSSSHEKGPKIEKGRQWKEGKRAEKEKRTDFHLIFISSGTFGESSVLKHRFQKYRHLYFMQYKYAYSMLFSLRLVLFILPCRVSQQRYFQNSAQNQCGRWNPLWMFSTKHWEYAIMLK